MSNRLALAALSAACIAAAAGGGYLATRQSVVPTPAAAQSQSPAAPVGSTAVPAGSPSTAAATPVQETEAVVGDNAKPLTTAAPANSPKNSSRRIDVPERPASPSRAARAPLAKRSESASTTQGGAQTNSGVLSSTWPSGASQQPAITPGAPSTEAPAARADEHPTQEPARPAEPPRPTFDELVVARDSVIGLQLDNRVSTETARVEDRVDAHVSRDVKVGDRVAIPAGSHVIGSVTQVTPGGKFKEQARLGIRFHTLVLADGSRLPISTETIVRLGDAPGNSSAAKIGGGAVGGAILGAILGGAKGAAIGATAGAGAGTAAVTASDRSAVTLAAGTQLTPRILSPVTVTVEREREEQ